ncbi:MAG: hypothetical protein LUG60_14915 [Erysipelotrichaceae bacterium]|nr:hypothetical protein [Erysipelotrichaceae bacterium]
MKVMFLDIDGVLQPYNNEYAFCNKIPRDLLIKYISLKYQRDYFMHYSLEVRYCLLDWDVKAIRRIRHICEKTDAKIVMSSGWRPSTYGKDDPTHLRDLLHIWDLDKYYLGETEVLWRESSNRGMKMDKAKEYLKDYDVEGFRKRVVEIVDYLLNHDDITNYVVIDDMDLYNAGLDGHYVRTCDIINDDQAKECIKILNSSYNIQNDLMQVNKKIVKNV